MNIYCISHVPDLKISGGAVIPLFVGEGGCPENWMRDNIGDNISKKNKSYSELTAQYWVWKNIFPEVSNESLIGFFHYRRYLLNPLDMKGACIYEHDFFHETYYDFLLEEFFDRKIDCVIPVAEVLSPPGLREKVRRIRKITSPFFWGKISIFNHYQYCHDIKDLENSINEMGDEFRGDFATYIMREKSMIPYNIIIASRRVLDQYFSVLFPWLLRCEGVISVKYKKSYQARLFGFLAERFFSFYFSRACINSIRLPIGLVGHGNHPAGKLI